MRDAEGQPLKDDRGKIRYRTPIRWRTPELREAFSQRMFDLVEASAGTTPKVWAESPRDGLIRRPQRPPRIHHAGPDLLDDDLTDLWREGGP